MHAPEADDCHGATISLTYMYFNLATRNLIVAALVALREIDRGRFN